MTRSKTTHEPTNDLAQRVASGLAKLSLVFRHEAWRASAEHGLAPMQAQIVSVLAGTPEPIGVTALAERLAVTPGTVSAAVSTLAEKGLVTKQRGGRDARAVTIRLTRVGRAAAKSAASWPETVLASAEALPAAEQAGLVRGLVGMIRELQERGSVPTARMCVGCVYFRPNEHAGDAKQHHCAYIDAPIGDADLRFDCPEMEPAPAGQRERLWQVFVSGRKLEGGVRA